MNGQEIAFRLHEEQEEYLSEWMQKVSRSFALVVPFVEEPLTHYLATAYLLCRVADNIEDCAQPVAWKHARFAELATLLEDPDAGRAGAGPVARTKHGRGSPKTSRRSCCPPTARRCGRSTRTSRNRRGEIMRRWVRAMAEGMADLDEPEREPRFVNRDGVQVLGEEADYNGYCYIVAGTVGHMSTELVIQHYDVDAEAGAPTARHGRGVRPRPAKDQHRQGFRQGPQPRRLLSARPLAAGCATYAPLALDGAPHAWSLHGDRQRAGRTARRDATTCWPCPMRRKAIAWRACSVCCLPTRRCCWPRRWGPCLFTPTHRRQDLARDDGAMSGRRAQAAPRQRGHCRV